MPDKALTDRLLDALMKMPGVEERSTRTAILNGIGVSLNRTDNQFVDLTNIIRRTSSLRSAMAAPSYIPARAVRATAEKPENN